VCALRCMEVYMYVYTYIHKDMSEMKARFQEERDEMRVR
jgi:hypothetical protein